MTKRLHLVYGGELATPTETAFKDVNDSHLVGFVAKFAKAYDAWKNEAKRTLDTPHMRYFIAHLHRLFDEDAAACATKELG